MSDEIKTGLMDKIKKILAENERSDDDLYYDDIDEELSDEQEEAELNPTKAQESCIPILCDVNNSKLHIGSEGVVTVISCEPNDLADIYEAIASMLNYDGFVNIDFSDVNLSNANGGVVKIYKAFATGDDCCAVAAQMIARSSINADSVILLIEASNDVTFMEVDTISSTVSSICHPDARIVWGVNLKEEKTKTVKISVLAFDEHQ